MENSWKNKDKKKEHSKSDNHAESNQLMSGWTEEEENGTKV